MNLDQLHALVSIAVSGVPTSENTREQLVRVQLIQDSTPELTERGQVFLEHVLALPLPEQIAAWKMPLAAAAIESSGPPPPAPPPPNRVAPRPIPTDPAELRAEALRMLDSGYGMNETAEFLKLSADQVQAIFYGAS